MVPMRSAIFVGMRQIKEPVGIVSKLKYRVVHTENLEKALRAIYIISPDLLLVNSAVENGESGLFIKTVRSRFPELRIPIILFHDDQSAMSLVIYEWSSAQGTFVMRTGQFGDLHEEIARFSRPSSERLEIKGVPTPAPEPEPAPAPAPEQPPERVSEEEPPAVTAEEMPMKIPAENLEDLRNIGFANTIQNGERSFHIQTEIMTFRGVKIKTTILERGIVVDAIVHPLDGARGDVVAWTQETARQQHEGTVQNVRRGKYD